jgi:hypothetical protein
MTLSEKLIIFEELVGSEFVPRYEDLRVTSCGKEYQLTRISCECNGEIYITLRDPKSRKEFDTSLKVYNQATHRYSYDKELISSILRALGRKRVKEAKEASGYPFK